MYVTSALKICLVGDAEQQQKNDDRPDGKSHRVKENAAGAQIHLLGQRIGRKGQADAEQRQLKQLTPHCDSPRRTIAERRARSQP